MMPVKSFFVIFNLTVKSFVEEWNHSFWRKAAVLFERIHVEDALLLILPVLLCISYAGGKGPFHF